MKDENNFIVKMKYDKIICHQDSDSELHKRVMQNLQATKEFCESDDFDRSYLETSNKNKQRPLHLAVNTLNYDVVKYLLELGAEVDSMKKGSWTGLMIISCKQGEEAENIVKLLLSYGANPRIQCNKGYTPLHYAAHHHNHKLIRILCSAAPECSLTQNSIGRTPLHLAIATGCEKTIKSLLELGDINMLNIKDKLMNTPISYAIEFSNNNIIKLLTEINKESDNK